MASSSLKPNPQWIYDVFISFREEDTRRNIVSHLYASLSNAGINTFIDDSYLEKGKKPISKLMRAIEVSQISLVILSENYASSTWCLQELNKIMDCVQVSGMSVMPIFYHVDPSEVRKQSGHYEEVFAKHEERLKDDLERMAEVKSWRESLIQVANLGGWDIRNNDESTIVKQITDEVLTKLDRKYLSTKSFKHQGTHKHSSSKTKSRWIHDVFINFRGKDTRKNFISHLYAALSNAGIDTFLDDENLERGNELEPALMRAIEGSQLLLVVLSKNYASSTWCLRELVKILECTVSGGIVVPIFYDVDPSEVRKQSNNYEYAFAEHEERFKDDLEKMVEVKGWREALTQVGNLSGWNVEAYMNESDMLNKIVETVRRKLQRRDLYITDFPVGLESRIQHAMQFSRKETRGVILGIWGMGGMGKSTIAKAIYNVLCYDFANRCFLANIREVWEKDRGQIDLQEQLLSNIVKTRKTNVHSIELGKTIIKERLCTKMALVVLDDVSNWEQLNALCGNRDDICPGSMIIITTRDVHLLNVLQVDYVYEVEGLNEMESLELFSWHAFREANPREDFLSLSKDIVAYCGGLPLALEVLGRHLKSRGKEEWKCALSKLQKIPNGEIQKILKISFDGLEDHMVKDIFLDICCIFIGKNRAYVTEILNGCDLEASIGIPILEEKSLIKIERNNKIGMHDLLRDMGRDIISESKTKKPKKRSRLWFHKEVLDVLTEDKGTNAIEGLALKLHKTFNTHAFKKMKRLRLLQLDRVQLDGDYGHLSNQLKWICWQRFPLRYIPDEFYPENAVAIDLKHSNLRLVWKKPQLMERLKILNLSHSKYLTNTPDFSKLPNLEQLIMKDCPNLCEIHQSIGELHNIVLINMADCTSISNLPRVMYKLKSVKTLILSGCSKIDKLEEDIVQMESLTTLMAKNTAVKQVPFSIVTSKSIGYISLCGYEL